MDNKNTLHHDNSAPTRKPATDEPEMEIIEEPGPGINKRAAAVAGAAVTAAGGAAFAAHNSNDSSDEITSIEFDDDEDTYDDIEVEIEEPTTPAATHNRRETSHTETYNGDTTSETVSTAEEPQHSETESQETVTTEETIEGSGEDIKFSNGNNYETLDSGHTTSNEQEDIEVVIPEDITGIDPEEIDLEDIIIEEDPEIILGQDDPEIIEDDPLLGGLDGEDPATWGIDPTDPLTDLEYNTGDDIDIDTDIDYGDI